MSEISAKLNHYEVSFDHVYDCDFCEEYYIVNVWNSLTKRYVYSEMYPADTITEASAKHKYEMIIKLVSDVIETS